MVTTSSGARVGRYALSLVTLGATILAICLLTSEVAPPGANAKTAVIIGGAGFILLTMCALLSLMINRNRALGMIGIHIGLLLPLLLASGPLMRVSGSIEKAKAYYETPATETPAQEEQEVTAADSDHPYAYQAVGLGSVALVSVFGFIMLITQRPSIPKQDKQHGG